MNLADSRHLYLLVDDETHAYCPFMMGIEKGKMKHVQVDHLFYPSTNPKSMFPQVEGGPSNFKQCLAMSRITLRQSLPLRDSLEDS